MITLKTRATLSVLAAGTLWGIISLFIKPLASLGLTPIQVPFMRMLVASISFVLFLLITDKEKLKIQLKDIWMFIGTGIVSVTLFNSCYFYAVVHGQASIAVVLMYTSPIFIMLLSVPLFKEKLTFLKIAALILTILGCIFVSGIFGSSYTLSTIILLAGLGSGLFYALYTIFGRYALAKYDSATVTAYTFLFGLFGSLFMGKLPDTYHLVTTKPIILLWCLGLGIICTVIPYFLYTWGLNHMEPGKAAIVVAIEPIVGALVGIFVFKESHSILKILGIVLIVLAILLVTYSHYLNSKVI